MKKTLLRIARNYIYFFSLVAFVITCCSMLFLSVMESELGVALTEKNIGAAAKLTFWNVALLSLIFTAIDTLRRKLTVERPAKEIANAAEKIVQGDYSVRVKPQGSFGTDGAFNQIIECFNKMVQELDSVETLRGDFIANVSHEMRTPLTVIKNYGTLLQAPGLPDEKRLEYGKGVADAAGRMAEMMTNILKLNQLENQQIYPQTEEFDLSEQLCQCLLQFENVWESKEIQIETQIVEQVTVRSDAQLLSLVWNNLFSNAFKFTGSGGKVSVSLSADNNHAIISVEDNGCGMTPEVGTHIFEKFYQGDPSHSIRGNGLGLALVKRVIDIVQGEIAVKSALGEGTTFIVKIGRV